MKTSLANPATPTVRTTRRLAFRNAAACVAVLLVVSVFASLRPGTADAGMIVNIEQQGSDVVASYSGSIDLTGIGFRTVPLSGPFNRIAASRGEVNFLNGAANRASLTSVGENPWTVAPSAFGTGNTFDADTVSVAAGNAFGFQASGFFIESSYVSGTTISGSMTFENQTLASMGINAGVGIVNATFSSGDTLTVNTAVPEPTSVALLFTGVAGCVAAGGMRRRRRLSQAAGDR